MDINKIILSLHSLGTIQFGKYEIKRNFTTPFQVDLASMISEAELAKAVCKILWEKIRKFDFDLICGVPTIGALLAGFISWEVSFPMITQRSDGKSGPQFLGKFKSNQRCLVIQDVLGFGVNVLSFVEKLEEEGLKVIDSVSLIDLEIGGKKRLKSRGISNHSVIYMKDIMETLFNKEKLSGDKYKLTKDFFENLKETK